MLLQEDATLIKTQLEEGMRLGELSPPWLTQQSLLWEEEAPGSPEAWPRVASVLAEGELLGRYWHLTAAARLLSISLQKWVGSLVCLVSAWATIRAAYWFSSSPTFVGVSA